MPVQCYVCKLYSHQENAKGVSFHRFPADPNAQKVWMSLLGYEEGHKFPKLVRICSNHFQKSDFIIRDDGRKFLKHGAGPLPSHSLFIPLEQASSESDEDTTTIEDDILSNAGPSHKISPPISYMENMVADQASSNTSTASETKDQLNKEAVSASLCQESLCGIQRTSFPANPETRKIWLSVLGYEEDHKFPKLVEICSNHFQESDYKLRYDGSRCLKRDAVPLCTHSLFNSLESKSSETTDSSSPTKSQEKDGPSVKAESEDNTALSSNFQSNFAKTSSSFGNDTMLGIARPPYKLSPSNSFKSNPAKERLTFGDHMMPDVSRPCTIAPNNWARTPANESLTFGHDTMISISTLRDKNETPLSPFLDTDQYIDPLDSMVVKHVPSTTWTTLQTEEELYKRYGYLESECHEDDGQKRKIHDVDNLKFKDFSTPKRAKRNIYLLKKTITKHRKKIHSLQTTVLSLRRQVDTLKESLKSLKNETNITDLSVLQGT